MSDKSLFYSAVDIALPLVADDVPQTEQFAFLEWLRENDKPFLSLDWRKKDGGFRTMLLDVQNAISYLVDQNSFEAERKEIEEEGGTLPRADSTADPCHFLKTIRLKMGLAEFLGRRGANQKRMKCSTILKLCGVRRRSEAFCHDFELAAAFYHIGLRRGRWDDEPFSIAGFPLASNLFLVRL